jgi:hypothetical protein
MWLITFLQGKKSYIVAIVIVVLVVIEKVIGIDIPGFEMGEDWGKYIIGSATISTLHAAIQRKKQNSI